MYEINIFVVLVYLSLYLVFLGDKKWIYVSNKEKYV